MPNNRISSSIMPSFAFMTKATTIDLHRNNFSGALVATAFDMLTSLTVLDLATNRILGPLPLLAGCTSLTRLVLSSNQFAGAVPVTWSGLSGLEFVSLKDNQVLYRACILSRSLLLSVSRFSARLPRGADALARSLVCHRCSIHWACWTASMCP